MIARCCGHRLCLNPLHLRAFANRRELGEFIVASGRRRGTAIEQRRACARIALAAQGRTMTPRAVVMAIKSAPASVSTAELARLHGIKRTTASHIRNGRTFKDVLP